MNCVRDGVHDKKQESVTARTGCNAGRKIVSTYRLQFTPQFTFRDAMVVIDCLKELGATAIYSSPIFEARQGSGHGYDVTDSSKIRHEFGTLEEFTALSEAVHLAGMSWLQGIVPNHMAFDRSNRLLRDVLENGRSSACSGCFDIDWDHYSPGLSGKVAAPFLGSGYYEALVKHELKLVVDDGVMVDYHGFRLPLSAATHRNLLDDINAFMPSGDAVAPSEFTGSGNDSSVSAVEIFRKLISNRRFERSARQAVSEINRNVEKVDAILSEQHFLLRWHGSASHEINYRRFFAVNDLIAVRVEEPSVFAELHSLTGELVRKGLIDGVRIDHIDGLSDPAEYLRRLRELTGDCYVAVEKITCGNERLRRKWPVEGSTGYDFMSWTNSLFVMPESSEPMTDTYRKFTGYSGSIDENVVKTKRKVVRTLLDGDAANVSLMLLRSMKDRKYGRDITLRRLQEAVIELLAHMAVYRTYFSRGSYDEEDVVRFRETVKSASEAAPELKTELNALLSLMNDAATDTSLRIPLMRLQQLMPAAMAKSVEDTFFFNYNALVSLNEVGSDPREFGLMSMEFHDRIAERFRQWPHSMNSTSTHDTKMGEDLRCRISVLSEIPEDWERNVLSWRAANNRYRKKLKSGLCPTPGDEYYIYQIILGSRPPEGSGREWRKRLKAHMVKYMREGGTSTSWEKPDLAYESGCLQFIEKMLSPGNNHFTKSFDRMQRKVSFHGFLNSMSMVTLKIMCPGVPDTYQGSESWNFSFVDPDNRRPVDFNSLKERLQRLSSRVDGHTAAELAARFQDGAVKTYLTRLLLRLRRQESDLFMDGEYIPLKTAGAGKNNIVSFARKLGEKCAVVSVPRYTTGLTGEGRRSLWQGSWNSTIVLLPAGFPSGFSDIFTGRKLSTGKKNSARTLMVRDVLVDFPVSVLVSGIDYRNG